LAKLLSGASGAPVLQVIDPVFLLPSNVVLITVGALELALCIRLFLGKPGKRDYVWILALSSGFILYRFARHLMGIKESCRCLGTITEWLPVSPSIIDPILIFSVAFMFFGSVLLLAIDLRTRTG